MSTGSEVSQEKLIRVRINGTWYERTVPARTLLVRFIREDLNLTGTHIGCDTGNCGACSVLCNDELIKSCMMLAVQANGTEIQTVESLAPEDGALTDLQQNFKVHHAVQCGYCTPGVLMASYDLLRHNPAPSEEDIRRGLKGNLCRCTGYMNIVKAVSETAKQRAQTTETAVYP